MTEKDDIIIRPATVDDLEAVSAIYAYYVANTTATYEEEAPDVAEFARRWDTTIKGNHPYLVAEENGKILGYGYAGTFRVRIGYRYTVEDSVYVAPDAIGKGIGQKMLAALIEQCTQNGFRQMVAVIGEPANTASIKLHAKMGFREVGVMPAVGFKFGRWVDSVIMMRPLGDGGETLP